MQDFKTHLEPLKEGKNLLGFSGGLDSTCLFFLLVGENIVFDIALVDYNTQKQRLEIIQHAQKLAKHTIKNATSITLQKSRTILKCKRERSVMIFWNPNQRAFLQAFDFSAPFEWQAGMVFDAIKQRSRIEHAFKLSSLWKRESYAIVRPLLYTPKDTLKTLAKDLKFLKMILILL